MIGDLYTEMPGIKVTQGHVFSGINSFKNNEKGILIKDLEGVVEKTEIIQTPTMFNGRDYLPQRKCLIQPEIDNSLEVLFPAYLPVDDGDILRTWYGVNNQGQNVAFAFEKKDQRYRISHDRGILIPGFEWRQEYDS